MVNSTIPKQLIMAVGIFVVLGVGLFQLIMLFKVEPEQRTKQRPVPAVEVIEVKLQPVAITIESQGTVQAKREIRLVSEVTGRVIWVSHRLQNGTLVEKDELLLKIDATDYEANVATAKAELLSAQLNYKDRKARYQKDSLTVKQAAAQVDAAEKQLARARNDLDKTQLSAPFAAAIRNKAVDVGQYIAAGNVLFELTGTESAEVRLPIHGNDISLLYGAAEENELDLPAMLSAKIGSQVAVWPARVTRIEAAVDDDTRVYYVVAQVDNPYQQQPQPLSLGLFVQAMIEAPALSEAAVLPRGAVHEERDIGHYVYRLGKDDALTKQSVDVARTEKEVVVITGGLVSGDRVVVTRLQQMYEGLVVSPQIQPSL